MLFTFDKKHKHKKYVVCNLGSNGNKSQVI